MNDWSNDELFYNLDSRCLGDRQVLSQERLS